MKSWVKRFLAVDAYLSKKLRIKQSHRYFSLILKIFAHSGDSWFWLMGLFLAWLFTIGEWRDRIVFIVVGMVIMAVAVITLKFSIRRPRPEGEWGQIYRITDPHSFPSGHAARSTALMVMAIAVGPPWFSVAVTLWAPCVGLSRVALGVHYFSDVLVGWLIGAAMGGVAVAFRPLILKIFVSFL